MSRSTDSSRGIPAASRAERGFTVREGAHSRTITTSFPSARQSSATPRSPSATDCARPGSGRQRYSAAAAEAESDAAPSGNSHAPRRRTPSGSAGASRAAKSSGLISPATWKSAYSALLRTPTGNAGPVAILGLGVCPREYSIAMPALVAALASILAKSSADANLAGPSFANLTLILIRAPPAPPHIIPGGDRCL